MRRDGKDSSEVFLYYKWFICDYEFVYDGD